MWFLNQSLLCVKTGRMQSRLPYCDGSLSRGLWVFFARLCNNMRELGLCEVDSWPFLKVFIQRSAVAGVPHLAAWPKLTNV